MGEQGACAMCGDGLASPISLMSATRHDKRYETVCVVEEGCVSAELIERWFGELLEQGGIEQVKGIFAVRADSSRRREEAWCRWNRPAHGVASEMVVVSNNGTRVLVTPVPA